MDRYDFIINLGMRSIIKKHPYGEYVKYEDVKRLLEVYINVQMDHATEHDIEVILKHF